MHIDKNFPYQTATELTSALANKEISSLELVEATIARIEKIDKNINAIVIRDFDRALQTAKAQDQAIARGQKLPLLGLPITVKECFNVTHLPTSWGDPVYKNYYPESDALAVARLKAAGAIVIGKTNVPLMLADWQTFNEIYGTTNNPYDLNCTPGGSSGGSAAALAAGLISLELGSDLAGSLRAPAHYCGIATHKPSLDIIPTRGACPPTIKPTPNRVDLVVAGPMARTVDDLILGLNIMAGPDELCEGKGYQLNLPPPRHSNFRDFRVLIINHHPLCATSTVITDALDQLAANLVNCGLTVSHFTESMLDLVAVTRNYASIYSAFLGELPQDEYETIQTIVKKLAVDDQSIKAHLLRAKVFTHRDWLIHSRQRLQLREAWRNLFKTIDVILCPVMPTPAFPHDHSPLNYRRILVNEEWEPYVNQLCWPSIATIFDSPATVIPINQTSTGLPIGVQIIGDYLEDYTTLKFAQLLEREFGGFRKP